MNGDIDVTTLTDGGQQALDVARRVAAFLDGARETLDLAQYDFHLLPPTATVVGGAIKAAAARGVRVRFVYNVDHRLPVPVPPPPEPDTQLIASLGVESRAIGGIPDLMHHKYVVRDLEAVWTGSMNWTDDSWSRQENVVAVVRSEELATRFAANFEVLWKDGNVEQSGFESPAPLDVGGTQVRPWFCPGNGEKLAHRIAKHIDCARRRVRICSPVITSGPVLGTLAELISEGRLDIAGCVDLPQVRGVIHQWTIEGAAHWKLPLLRRVMAGPFSGKPSTPWRPDGSLHDFMHAKLTVADDVVFAGSYNLSRSGERNAENVLEIHDAALAERLAGYVDEVRARYPRVELGDV
jgi:phosphatidylserine/phosphatidylglycerophosphate/cardiolipin synthase-like enzyme